MDFSFNGNKPENVLFNGNIVNKVLCNGVVVWEKSTIKYNVPFTITAIENTQIGMTHKGTNATTTKPQLEYSRNGINWTVWDYNDLNLNAGGSLYFRGNNPNGISGISPTGADYSTFTSTAKINISGNIMSLMHNGDFDTNWGVTYLCFYNLFHSGNKIVNAAELLLPATELADNCYSTMFYGCTSLVTAPVLPATTLAERCYGLMFGGCTSLVTAPVLPATTLKFACYEYMFYGCTSLVTAPVLPATELVKYCYLRMFDGCSKLNYIKCLATDIIGDDSTSEATTNWLAKVSSTGTFVRPASAASIWSRGVSGIPEGWTIQNA